MPSITPAQAVARIKTAVRDELDDADLVEVCRELLPSADPAALSRTELVAGVTAYLDDGLLPSQVAAAWRLVSITTLRDVWYNEDEDRIHYRIESADELLLAD